MENRSKRLLKSLPLNKNIELDEEQQSAFEVITNSKLTVLNGLAGTSKTFTACYAALHKFFKREVDRITIMRPMVGTEESKTGILPGTIEEKMEPWLLPVLENMYLIGGKQTVQKMYSEGKIRALPLNFAQGNTFVDEFVIVDESQNCTKQQVTMIITRLGLRSSMVFTGDPNQIQLKAKSHSGLQRLMDINNKVPSMDVFTLTKNYRDPIVREILEAYEKDS